MGNRRSIADIVEEKKKPKIGETSSSFQTLPKSYSNSTFRFFDDSQSSLQRHTENTSIAVEILSKKFKEILENWTEKHEELKNQCNVLARNKTQHRKKIDEFRSVAYGFIPGVDSSDSDDGD